jgi:hypothetical protein
VARSPQSSNSWAQSFDVQQQRAAVEERLKQQATRSCAVASPLAIGICRQIRPVAHETARVSMLTEACRVTVGLI